MSAKKTPNGLPLCNWAQCSMSSSAPTDPARCSLRYESISFMGSVGGFSDKSKKPPLHGQSARLSIRFVSVPFSFLSFSHETDRLAVYRRLFSWANARMRSNTRDFVASFDQ